MVRIDFGALGLWSESESEVVLVLARVQWLVHWAGLAGAGAMSFPRAVLYWQIVGMGERLSYPSVGTKMQRPDGKGERQKEGARAEGMWGRTDKEIRPHVLIINCCENVVETCNEQDHLDGMTLNSQVSVNSLYTD